MAKAIYEQRTFTNRGSGEMVKYDFYGVCADVNGEYMEINLSKILSPAEKIAFKVIASGENPDTYSTAARSATDDEKDDFFNNMKKGNADDRIDLDD